MLKKSILPLLGLALTCHSTAFAAVQVVAGATPVELDDNGNIDGVSFIGQGAVPSTLIVPINRDVNTNNNATGIASDSFGKSTVNITGNSMLFGTVGVSGGNALKLIQIGGNGAIFNGAVATQGFAFGSSTSFLNNNLTMPLEATLSSTILSNTTYGSIVVNEAFTNTITAPVVNVSIDALEALALTNGQVFSIINASMGTSGVPITVTGNNVRYTFTPENPGGTVTGSVKIVSNQVPIPTLVKNPNAKSVGAILDSALPVAGAFPSSDLAFIETQLGFSSAKPLEQAVLQISAAPGLMGVARESFNTVRQFQKIWLEHLQTDPYFSAIHQQNCCEDPCAVSCSPFRVWADGFFYYGNQGSKGWYNGYDVRTWGTLVAAEMSLPCALRAGLGFGYAYSNLNENLFGNSTNVHHYLGTAYMSYQPSDWFVDAGVSYGWNRYDGFRHINYNQVHRTAKAEYNGQQFSFYGVTGLYYTFDSFEITPMGSLLYSYLYLNDYTESGAQSLNLHVRKQNYEFFQSSLGVKASYLYSTCWGPVLPEIHTFWVHDFNPATLDATASLTGLGAAAGTFKNRGYHVDQNLWNIGTSLTCAPGYGFSLMAGYDYEKGCTYYDHQGILEIAYDF